jgi:hypothetical protein
MILNPSINLYELYVPIERCLTVRVGRINPNILETLKCEKYDQALVLGRSNETIGLVRTEELDRLYRVNEDLPENSTEIDKTSVSPKISLDVLLERLSTRQGIMVESDDEPSEIKGIITVSDLNKPRPRSILYLYLSDLESKLSMIIHERYDDPWEWINHLSEAEQARVLGYWELSKRRNVDPDLGALCSCTLTNLVTVVTKDEQLLRQLGYSSKKKAEAELNPLIPLRNTIMHAVRPLVLHPKDVSDLREKLQVIDRVLNRLGGFNVRE